MEMNWFGKLVTILVLLFALTNDVFGAYRSYRAAKDSVPFWSDEEVHTDFGEGDIIDLDEGGFDTALAQGPFESPRKHAEDTREVRFGKDVLTETFSDDSDHDGHRDEGGEIFSPIPMIVAEDNDNFTVHVNESDDEDLVTSGSGDGAIVIEIEESNETQANTVSADKVDHFLERSERVEVEGPEKKDATSDENRAESDSLATFIFQDFQQDETKMQTSTPTNLPPFCEELTNVTWTPWSPWIQAGDVDFRFRRCPALHGHKSTIKTCEGDYYEVRKCRRTDETICRANPNELTEEFHVRCSGLDINDIDTIEELRNPLDRKDDCEYTLYDMTYNMAIGEPINSDQLMTSDPHMWCLEDDKFVPFYTPLKKCLDTLNAFCKSSKICKYEGKQKKTLKHKGDLHKNCWKEFVLGGQLPAGIPDPGSHQMICQRFGKESKLGKAISSKNVYFATLYDVRKRIPVVSMVTVRFLGDDKWPRVPYMIERGLLQEESSAVMSWFFKDKKKGMTRPEEIAPDCEIPTCSYGEKQALPDDYQYSGYRIAPLITPDLIGGDIGARLSTFTLTNSAPMEPTVYSNWKKAIAAVRRFAVTECRLPDLADGPGEERHKNGHELPELYLIAGTASSEEHVEVIGNDVVVPEVFWMAVCCAHGANVSSFGIYAYNRYEQKPTVISIDNLQILLQSRYHDNIDVIDVNLYPAFNGVCSAMENDASLRIEII